MRIVAGTARGRRILAPDGQATRPITDRAKEGIFNMLSSIIGIDEGFDGLVVHDFFAGSGSFGLECLSRGAAHVTFVERGRDATRVIQQNLDTFGFVGRATILASSVESTMPTIGRADVAFCDPPYPDDPWSTILATISADLFVGHAERAIPLDDTWVELKRRKYGRSHIVLAKPNDSDAYDGTAL